MTAHKYPKNGIWHIYLYWKEEVIVEGEGGIPKKVKKKRQKWFDTGLPIKRGHDGKVNKMKEELLAKWKPILEPSEDDGTVLTGSSSEVLAQVAAVPLPVAEQHNPALAATVPETMPFYGGITREKPACHLIERRIPQTLVAAQTLIQTPHVMTIIQQPAHTRDDDYNLGPNGEGVLFADLLLDWLEKFVKKKRQHTTYQNYRTTVRGIVEPYFRQKGLYAYQVTPAVIEDYHEYLEDLGRGANTIHHHNSYISGALKFGIKKKYVRFNTASMVEKPRKEEVEIVPYSKAELDLLFNRIVDDPLWLVILIGVFYGLRRSEIIGLEWDCIDFNQKTIHIRQAAYTEIDANGKWVGQKIKKELKSKKGLRVLPLLPEMEACLRFAKERYKENARKYGRSYITKYSNYVCLRENGDWILLGYTTDHFPLFLENQGLRRIRFHDLRHTCATQMYNNKVDLLKIKGWLGHANIGTTEKYTHLGYQQHEEVAESISSFIPTFQPAALLEKNQTVQNV